ATRRIPIVGVPAAATAVVVNLTAVRPPGASYLTAWGGGVRPTTSALNVERDDVRSNRAIVAVGPDRSISVFASARTDVVVDLNFGLGVTSNALVGAVRPAGTIARTGRVGFLPRADLGRVESVVDLSGWFVAPAPSPPSGLWIGGGEDGRDIGALWDRRVPGL